MRYDIRVTGRAYADDDSVWDKLISYLNASPICDPEMEATERTGKFTITGYVEAETSDEALDVVCTWEAKVEGGLWVEMTGELA